MGWSVSTPCKSIKARDEMLEFLEQHCRTSEQVLKISGRTQIPSNYFAYGHSPSKIGFDKPNDYEICVLRWVALKVGKKRVFKSLGINKSVPWLNCDGHGSEPVITKDEFPQAMMLTCDKYGFVPVKRWWKNSERCDYIMANLTNSNPKLLQTLDGPGKWESEADFRDQATKQELMRLDNLWNHQNN